jgi:hypothetical protein
VLCGWRDEQACYASRQWISNQLNALRRLGDVDCATRRGGRGKVWFVTRQGALAAEQAAGPADRRVVVLRPAQVRARTQAHTLAVNAVGVAFTWWARRRPGDACAWTNEVAHRCMDGTGPSKGLFRADALLRVDCQLAAGRWAFASAFVELDRGTETLHQLGEKLRRYVQFAGYTPRGLAAPAWQAFYGTLPTVLVLFASPRQSAAGEAPEAFAARVRSHLEGRMDGLSAYCDADPLLHTALGLGDRPPRSGSGSACWTTWNGAAPTCRCLSTQRPERGLTCSTSARHGSSRTPAPAPVLARSRPPSAAFLKRGMVCRSAL